jgi:L-iditol 2-dehydrogenase
LVEPLAVAVHAVRRLCSIGGQNVLVLGAGTIGLMVVATLKAYAAGSIVVTDFRDTRLCLAKRLGADSIHDPGKTNFGPWLA